MLTLWCFSKIWRQAVSHTFSNDPEQDDGIFESTIKIVISTMSHVETCYYFHFCLWLKTLNGWLSMDFQINMVVIMSLNWYSDLMNILLWMLLTDKLFNYQRDSISNPKLGLQNHGTFQNNKYFMTLPYICV